MLIDHLVIPWSRTDLQNLAFLHGMKPARQDALWLAASSSFTRVFPSLCSKQAQRVSQTRSSRPHCYSQLLSHPEVKSHGLSRARGRTMFAGGRSSLIVGMSWEAAPASISCIILGLRSKTLRIGTRMVGGGRMLSPTLRRYGSFRHS